MSKKKQFIPLIMFLGLCLMLYVGLFRERSDELPSALLDKPLPSFNLSTVEDPKRIVTEKDLQGDVALINVWATWCPSCRAEHPYLMKLADEGVLIYGIDYKDDQEEARLWLKNLGNPYQFNINDQIGKLGIDLGVYGAPETYLIDHKGIIRYKHVGVVDDNVWKQDIKPLYDKLKLSAREAGQ